MESKVFEEIYNNLLKRVEWCDARIGPIKKKEDFNNLTVKDYLELLATSRTLQSDMDKILVETYHIIGMGNLTAKQQSQFISLLKRFLDYRSDLKMLASHKDAKSTPNIPTNSTYQLSILSNVTLKRIGRGTPCCVVNLEEKDNESVTNNQPYICNQPVGKFNVEKGRVEFLGCDSESFVQFLWGHKHFKSGSIEKFRNAINQRSTYLGLQFQAIDADTLCATVTTKAKCLVEVLKEIYKDNLI